MLKKIAGVAVALMVVLGSASVADATSKDSGHGGWWDWFSMPEVSVENRDLRVITHTEADANSGYNDQWGSAWMGELTQSLTTGQALANAEASIIVGMTSFGCGCFDDMDLSVENRDFFVMTHTDADANSGHNDQWGVAKKWFSDVSQTLTSGAAGAGAESSVAVGVTDFGVSE